MVGPNFRCRPRSIFIITVLCVLFFAAASSTMMSTSPALKTCCESANKAYDESQLNYEVQTLPSKRGLINRRLATREIPSSFIIPLEEASIEKNEVGSMLNDEAQISQGSSSSQEPLAVETPPNKWGLGGGCFCCRAFVCRRQQKCPCPKSLF